MKEIHIICNPVSGKGKTLFALNKIKEYVAGQSEIKLVVHETENIGHATIITNDLTSGSNPVTILVIGGDGSVNEVLNGIVNFENTTLGILPFGSGNDFVRALHLSEKDPVALFSAYVNNAQVKKVDYLLLNDKYRAINEIGLGMSAEVIAFRNKMKHFKPETQYKIATMIRAFLWKNIKFKMAIDKNGYSDVKSMWFTMNNGTTIGGGMVTAADAKVDDGLISVMFVRSFNRLKTIPNLIKCKKGNVDKIKTTGRFTCKEIDIDANNVVVEFDGNLLENQNHINVKIVPGKLNLLVTK